MVIFKEDPKNGHVGVEPIASMSWNKQRVLETKEIQTDPGRLGRTLRRIIPGDSAIAGVSGVNTPDTPVGSLGRSKYALKNKKVDQDKVQVQDGHLEETICLKLATYLMIMNVWRCA